MRHSEGGDDGNQRANAAERNDQAEQEEQMVDAVQNVMKAHHHKAAGGVVPVGIQPHQSGIAFQFIGARDPPGGMNCSVVTSCCASRSKAAWIEK